ncbi:histidine acid phosphatase [Cooperia oncophora]
MNPVRWGFEGDTELTSFGKRQSLGLGREMRRFVGDLVNENYLPNQAKYYSSSANRCQMTLQVALAGFYTPTAWADWNKSQFDFWSPVPYTIDDPMLRMYSVKDCPVSDQAWKPISDDTLPDLKPPPLHHATTSRSLLRSASGWKAKKIIRGLLNYIAKNTGWSPTISSAADLADNIIEMDLYKSPYPSWISKPTLRGYNAASFKKAVLSFSSGILYDNSNPEKIHQIRCAEYAPCRNIMGGVWLKNLLDSIRSAIKGEGPSVIGYASVSS